MISRLIKPFITTAVAFTLLTACNGGRNSSLIIPQNSPYQSYFYVPNAASDVVDGSFGSISMYKSDTGILYPLSPESAVLSNGYLSVAIAKSIGHAYLVNKYGNSHNPGESGTVSIYDINPENGTLTLSSAKPYIYAGYVPQAIAISKTHAYVVNQNGNSSKSGESGTVSIYDINQKDGTLTLSSAKPYIYTGYSPLAIAISESHAYVVNNVGNDPRGNESGTVSIYDIDPHNGTLTLSSAQSYEYTGYGPAAIAISESYAYVTNSLGESNDSNSVGTISMYRIDKNTGALSNLSPSTVLSTGYLPAGIAINGSYAYVTNFYGESNDGNSLGNISMYSINQNGALSKLSPSTESSTGYRSTAIALNGDYAYVTNVYGESNEPGKSVGTVSIYNINSVGALTLSPVESYVYTQYVPSFSFAH